MNKNDMMTYFNKKTIYGITAQKFSKGRSNLQVVEEMLKAGIRIIQYREKEKKLKEKYEECLVIRKMTKDYNAILIINDHVDLCQMVDADGVHIGQDDYPVCEVRKLIGDKIIGVSTHGEEQLVKAYEDGADYVGVGPIFETFTKEDVVRPVGIEYLRWASKYAKIPYVAIGGIKEWNLKSIVENGGRCIAMVTEIVGADDIQDKIKRLYKIMEG